MMFEQLIDFRKLSSALITEIKTRNNTYRIRFVAPDGKFEISGGALKKPIKTDSTPFIVGIGGPMFFDEYRTSSVQSVTIKQLESEEV